MITNLFASTLETPTLKAEPVLQIGPITVNNSQLLGLFVMLILVVLFVFIASKVKPKPTKNLLATLIESIVEYSINIMSEVMHSRRKAIKYAPLVLTLFFVIIINNWAGLLPGVGHAITTNTHEGTVPLLRGFTSDLNNTLALAIVTIIMVQAYAIAELKPVGYLKHFFSDKPYNPINLFVGLLELIGEFTKVMSLSLRLFGNIFAGEVLLLVIGSISGYFAPVTTLPFIIMELFVGFIQAFVFAMLTVVYLAIATDKHEYEAAHSDQNLTSKPLNVSTNSSVSSG